MLRELIASDTFVPETYVGWRASEIGHHCDTYLVRKKLRHPVAPISGRIRHLLDDGRAHERDIVSRLIEFGFEVHHSCLEGQRQVHYGDVWGHPDGLLRTPKLGTLDAVDANFRFDRSWYLLEVTAPNSASFRRIVANGLRGGLLQKFVQIQVYLASSEISKLTDCCVVVVKNKNTSELYEEGVSFDRTTVEWVEERVKRLDEFVCKGIVPDARCNDWHRDYCPYRRLCFENAESEKSLVSGTINGLTLPNAEELLTYAELWKRGKTLESEGRELVEEAREAFLAVLEEYGAEALVVNDVYAKMIDSERRVCDLQALEAYPEAYSRCVSVSKSRYLRVTQKGVL